MEQFSGTSALAPAHAELRDDTRPPGRRHRQRRARLHEKSGCNLSQALELAIGLGCNRASARDIRLHAYMVEDLWVAEDQHSVLGTLDAMLAMATGLATRGSLVVCQAMGVGSKVRVRLQFAGEPPCRDASAVPVLDCDLRRDWAHIPARHRRAQ